MEFHFGQKTTLPTFVTTTPELILKYCFCPSVSGAKLKVYHKFGRGIHYY
jgi:hypothetical protein